jgi:hypothetical protein
LSAKPESKNEVERFKNKIESGGGLPCHGMDFPSYIECEAFFRGGQVSIGIFTDAFAQLHTVKRTVVFETDALRDMEARRKALLGNALEASVVTSFDTQFPGILAASGEDSPHEALAARLKTFKDYKKPGRETGVSHQILKGLKSVTKRSAELRRNVTPDAAVTNLAQGMAADSKAFNNGLVKSVLELYEELTADTAYGDQEAWNVCIDCQHAIWEELARVKGVFADAAALAPGLYLGWMLWAWEVQQWYLEHGFNPALTGIMVRRLLMLGGDTSVKDKLAKVNGLVTRVEENFRSQGSLIRQVQADLKRKHDK